jgi:hypothetical protein
MTNTISKDQAVSGWINGFIGVLLLVVQCLRPSWP